MYGLGMGNYINDITVTGIHGNYEDVTEFWVNVSPETH